MREGKEIGKGEGKGKVEEKDREEEEEEEEEMACFDTLFSLDTLLSDFILLFTLVYSVYFAITMLRMSMLTW